MLWDFPWGGFGRKLDFKISRQGLVDLHACDYNTIHEGLACPASTELPVNLSFDSINTELEPTYLPSLGN